MLIGQENMAFQIIKDSVNELFPESSILLFGSRARQDNQEDSDDDLLIITNEAFNSKEIRKYKALIRKKLAKSRIPADIIIQSKSEVEINKEIIGHIVRQVLQEGVPI